MKQTVKVVGIFLTIISLACAPLESIVKASDTTIAQWTSQADFGLGINSNTSETKFNGDVVLNDQSGAYTDTTKEQFDVRGLKSSDGVFRASVLNAENGEVTISSGYTYSVDATPDLLSDSSMYHSFLDETRHLLYVSSRTDGGLSVINTQGTTDPSDDTLVTRYTTSTTPALGGNNVFSSWLDDERNLLYVNQEDIGGGGLTVINTQGTVSAADDTLVKTYTTVTTPAIADNDVLSSFLDDSRNLLYVSTWGGGLSVINTQGTVSAADDTLVKTYKTSTTPAIASNNIMYSFLDSTHNLVYVGTDSGLSVINTQGTVSAADDTLVIRYTTSTTPSIGNNSVYHAFLDSTNNLLYVSTLGGLSVINTQGTVSAADDTLVKTYTTTTTPSIASNSVMHAFLDSTNNLLYVSTLGGLSVINTQGTVSAADDTLVKTYTTVTTPAIADNDVMHSFLDSAHNLLYVSTYGGGISVIDLDGEYNQSGVYVSAPHSLSTTPAKNITFDRVVSSNQSASVSYRSGDADALFRDDYEDGSAPSTTPLWGAPFGTVSESGGVLRLSDPQDASFSAMNIDTGKAANYFPAGSIIRFKARVNTSATNFGMYFGTEDFENLTASIPLTNSWSDITLDATLPFSQVSVYGYWDSGTWNNATDSVEIDQIQIEIPDSAGHWSSWSTSCTDNTSCPINQSDLTGKSYIQYKLNLTTTDTTTTPTVSFVTLSDGYQSQGTYTSQDLDFSSTNELLSFSADDTVPAETSIQYEYSTDQGATWTALDESYAFAEHFKANHFQWRATLSTSDTNVTPIIHSVSISSTESNLNDFMGDVKPEYERGDTITFDSNNYSREENPKLNGINVLAKNGSVTIYQKRKQGGKKTIGMASLDSNGYWEFNLPKEKDGKSVYYLQYTDSVGNQSTLSKSFTMVRDTNAPDLSLPIPKRFYKVGDVIEFEATDDETDIDVIKVKFNTNKWRKQNNQSFIIPDSIKKGLNTFKVRVYDKARNSTLKSMTVWIR